MMQIEAWFNDSSLLLAQRIRRFVFVMTMSVVLVMGVGMLGTTITQLPATQKKSNQEAVTVLGEAMSTDLSAQIDSLRQLGSSSLAWTALTDSTGREAYLKPFLISREKDLEGSSTQLLDYKGRQVMGTKLEYVDTVRLDALISKTLQKKTLQTQVLQSDNGVLMVVVVPVLFPYSREVIGALTSTINVSQVFERRVVGLGNSLGVELQYQDKVIATTSPGDMGKFVPAHFDLRLLAPLDEGVLQLSLYSTRNPWLLPLLRQLAYSLGAALVLGALAWRGAALAGNHLSRRLNALSLASEEVTSGMRESIPDDHSPDEIGVLTRALSQSLQAHRHINLHLEEMVRDKTRELSESEHRFRSLFEKSTLIMLLVDPDSGAILQANQAAVRFYGYDIAELQRKQITDINCQASDMVAAEMELARQEKREYFQFTHRLRSGETRPVEVHSTPIQIGDKQVLFSVVHDISERIRAEESLRLSDLALKAISQGVLIFDAHGIILSATRAFTSITGFQAEDIVGCSHSVMHGKNTDVETIRAIGLAAAAGLEFNGEILNYRKDGSTFWNDLTLSPVFAPSGGVIHFIAIIRDVTGRKVAEDKVQLAANVFTHAREGILITDRDGTIVDTNQAFSDITGYSHDEVVGKNPSLFSSKRHDKEFYAVMWHALLNKGHWYGEVWNRRKDGELFVEMLNISAVRNARGEVENFVALFSDITAIKNHEKQLVHIAHFDALTGLANRVLLADRLNIAMLQAQRRGLQLAVVYLDLDGFKAVNDTHGHAVGDQLLVAVSQRMKQALREGDTLARIGGDEFIAVLADLPEFTTSVPVLSRLLSAASLPVDIAATQIHVSASVGVSFFPQPSEVDADQLMRQADQAMYQAKLAGKNRYHVYDAQMDQTVRSLHESLEHIRHALAREQFVLYYQPKVHMRTGAIVGVEALIRWQHPQLGLLVPGDFLPSIESHSLAVEVGEWVIKAALAQIQQWRKAGISLPVSVNIGAGQLQQVNFFARLVEALAPYPDLPLHSLEIEILESNALHDFSGVSHLIDQCKELGVSFTLDDFGTGYSSLIHLKRLNCSGLKIDQSFVRGMHDNANDRAILQAIVGLASAMGMQVIAEGVETIADGVGLLRMGCELAQGYVIARPMPAASIESWVNRWQPPLEWQSVRGVASTRMALVSIEDLQPVAKPQVNADAMQTTAAL